LLPYDISGASCDPLGQETAFERKIAGYAPVMMVAGDDWRTLFAADVRDPCVKINEDLDL
jgi:hypothetical protein